MTNSGFSGDLEGKFEVVEIGTDGRVQPEREFRW